MKKKAANSKLRSFFSTESRRSHIYCALILNIHFSRDPPLDEGGRSDTQYRVECPLCSAAVVMTPKSPNAQTSVTVANLQPGATYKIRVLAINGVSGLSVANDNFAEVQAFSNADSQSAVVTSLKVVEVRANQVKLLWRPPRDQLDVDAYEVRYFVRGGSR